MHFDAKRLGRDLHQDIEGHRFVLRLFERMPAPQSRHLRMHAIPVRKLWVRKEFDEPTMRSDVRGAAVIESEEASANATIVPTCNPVYETIARFERLV